MIKDSALYKFAKLYVLPWNELWDKAAKDPELVDATAEVKAAGYDAQMFVRDIPIKPDGTIVGDLDSYKAQYATVFTAPVSPLVVPPIKATVPAATTPVSQAVSVSTPATAAQLVTTAVQPIVQAPTEVKIPEIIGPVPAAEPEKAFPQWAYYAIGGGILLALFMAFGGGGKPEAKK